MDNSKELVSPHDLVTILEEFITKTDGLEFSILDENKVSIAQKADAKNLKISRDELIDILLRKDSEGKEFIQVNFSNGSKILLTDQLIGFKPHPIATLDNTRLPKVVTTLDLVSVIEAIEETVASHPPEKAAEEIEVLQLVYQSIIVGGEKVGFDMSQEKSWIKRVPSPGGVQGPPSRLAH